MGIFTLNPDDPYFRERAIKDEQERQRVELKKSLRHQHWESSQSLIEYKIWSTKINGKLTKPLHYFFSAQFLKKNSSKRRLFIRIPVVLMMSPMYIVVFYSMVISFGLFVFMPVAIVKLTPTSIRYWLTYSKKLYKFNKRIRDENTARDNEKKQEEIKRRLQLQQDEIKRQLQLEKEKAREEERLAKQLVVFWRREFENSSDESLLDVWAVLQQFPTDHYFYFMLENSPGPILRSIVDQEVSNRSISVEARQFALHRLERKTADASHYRHLDQLAYRAQRDAQERHSEVMDGLMGVALRHLYR